ncbi:cation transmembrane transporter [Aureococcus anophagefferens]|nr:cation transmembrane transporter [Aureococcus anophagefferens]
MRRAARIAARQTRITPRRRRLSVLDDAKGITAVGAVVNVGLGCCKVGAGSTLGSPALIADGAHSLSDVLTDVVAYWSYAAARLPPDADHPFGHGKFEAGGSAVVGGALVAAGAGAAHHAAGSVFEPAEALELYAVATARRSRDAARELLDETLDGQRVARLERAVAAAVPRCDFSLRARKAGPGVLVDLRLGVEKGLSASAAHQIGEHAKVALGREARAMGLGLADVAVHLDPGDRQESGATGELAALPDELEKRIRAVALGCDRVRAVSHVVLSYEGESIAAKVDVVLPDADHRRGPPLLSPPARSCAAARNHGRRHRLRARRGQAAAADAEAAALRAAAVVTVLLRREAKHRPTPRRA